MINDGSFGYLKANTVLFAEKICQSLNDMCGARFITNKESLREGSFSTPLNTVMFIGFAGAIQGYYLLSFEERIAMRLIGIDDAAVSPEEGRDRREEYIGMLKEVLNIAVGQAIEELEKSFSDLTFSPSTVVYGEIEFPNILCGSIEAAGREGKLLCGFSINLANLKIGEKLEETLLELEQRTSEAEEGRRNIATILELLPIGLLAIDKTGLVLPGYSKSTPSIVGYSPEVEIVGRSFPEVIGAPAEISHDWGNWLTLAFFRFGEIPFKDIVDLCMLYEFKNSYGHVLKVNWIPVPDAANGILVKLLAVIEDVTRASELETKMAEVNIRHQENIELISQVINLQPDEITDFIYDSSELLSNAQTIVKSNNVDREFINNLFRTFHTLKGSSGQYRFKSLQELARKVEDHLKLFRDDATQITEHTIDEIKNSIEDAKGYINRIQDLRTKLGSKDETLKHKALRDPETVTTSLRDIDELVLNLSRLMEKCVKQEYDRYFIRELSDIRDRAAGLRTIRLSFFISAFKSLLENTCEKTGKKANLIMGNDVDIDITIMRKIHQCMIHLINNAIDHGIELPAERIRAGKIETGVLALSGESVNGILFVWLSDDGRGIDIQAIKRVAVATCKVTCEQAEVLTEEELYRFLLKPGFTTKTEATDISGRGVGMDFVNNTVESLGGRIRINSDRVTGTEITMMIPIK